MQKNNTSCIYDRKQICVSRVEGWGRGKVFITKVKN